MLFFYSNKYIDSARRNAIYRCDNPQTVRSPLACYCCYLLVRFWVTVCDGRSTNGSGCFPAVMLVNQYASLLLPNHYLSAPVTSDMKIRGQRVCQACSTEWSYYETGSIACPSCGSLRSTGHDEERQLHTDAPAALPLASFRDRIAEESIPEYADDLKGVLREYTRKRGFINGGELQPLDDRYLTAHTLLHTLDILARQRDPTADAELYLLSLYETLIDADDRAAPEQEAMTSEPADVPSDLRAAWGSAVADAVDAYCRDLRTWLDETPDAAAATALSQLRDHINRFNALQGDVEPAVATALVAAARAVGRYLRTGDDDALTTARDRLTRLAEA